LISVNNDGLGYDYLHIDNIELYPENEISIFNRWGNIVFQAKGYDNYNVKFTGINLASKNVTDGVFYYVLKISNENVPQTSALTKGYFILKK
jgi:gliding motility-associated-like protein